MSRRRGRDNDGGDGGAELTYGAGADEPRRDGKQIGLTGHYNNIASEI
jgi:hypothetical protein